MLHLANSHYSNTSALFSCTSAPVPISMRDAKLSLPPATALQTTPTNTDIISPIDISTMHQSSTDDISCATSIMSPPSSLTSLPQLPIIGEHKPWYFITPKSFAVVHLNIQCLLCQVNRLRKNIREYSLEDRLPTLLI